MYFGSLNLALCACLSQCMPLYWLLCYVAVFFPLSFPSRSTLLKLVVSFKVCNASIGMSVLICVLFWVARNEFKVALVDFSSASSSSSTRFFYAVCSVLGRNNFDPFLWINLICFMCLRTFSLPFSLFGWFYFILRLLHPTAYTHTHLCMYVCVCVCVVLLLDSLHM